MSTVTIDYQVEGDIFNIQRFSLNDGPGIRTIVFLKGCPLSCWWCSNPESQRRRPVVMYNADKCMHCRRCEEVCKQHAVRFLKDGTRKFFYENCTGSGECAAVCEYNALEMKGQRINVGELIKILKKDRSTFRHSGGGVTVSGGIRLCKLHLQGNYLKRVRHKDGILRLKRKGVRKQKK
ncbi:glycyl-radical enzyme activating protein [uncultured Megasphaera sp.]|uniref:glycyl-radical enzyme activating protein n=1 Tax=uncultured Megasphaera sp. TaxID=165188 RepID=UPI00288B0CED|nr:glycyl-radical enzyme activating protein [uncultured Megasphaera sp.]